MEDFLYSKINYTYHHSVEAENEHGADGDEGDDATPDVVEQFGEVDEGIYGYKVYHII